MWIFTPRYLKDAKLLEKGVKKFIAYKRDILKPEKLELIEKAHQEFKEGIKSKLPREALEEKAKEVRKVCEQSLPQPTLPALRENVEVFFVAIVIALGIRAYFLQPFRIPTGSMQPTLNGVVGTPLESEEEATPNIIKKGWDLITKGRNYVNVVADRNLRVPHPRYFESKEFLKFFTFTSIDPRDGEKPIRIWSNVAALQDLGIKFGQVVKKGEVLVRGYIDTGDQVLVNKMAYHFRKPKRGEVFVFTTKDIDGIRLPNQNMGSQHYIKRLVGVPGDHLQVQVPKLFIDGEEAREEGIRRVWSKENGYNGYGPGAIMDIELDDKSYWAMGDNSYNSSDSRTWGSVREENLVGSALCVYWPFTSHWGLID